MRKSYPIGVFSLEDAEQVVSVCKGAVYSRLIPAARRIFLCLLLFCLLYSAIVFGLYFLAPRQNAKLGSVDTLVVLGCPTMADGSPSPEERARVMEGVRELNRGVSRHIIMTGAAAHNQFVEAHAMAILAEANGVPAYAILQENQANDTIQNIFYSNKIMEASGWHTTEIISSQYHLPRTALILRHYSQLQWKTHPSPWPSDFGPWRRLKLESEEAFVCFRIRIEGFPPSKYLPK
jgi:uncharacterized SAM-binding protein YcdF (DUF218 family)